MIITSRYVYKKYKKRKQAKEEALANDSAHHEEVVQGTLDEIANAPAEQLCADMGSPSDPPPGYSSLDNKASHSSPALNSGLNENSTFWPHPPQPQMPAFPSASISPMSPTPMCPAGPAQQTPTEIEVRGKWVWVPETNPAPDVTERKSQYNPDNHGGAIELPACGTPKEMAVTPISPDGNDELDDIPELDGTLVSDKQNIN